MAVFGWRRGGRGSRAVGWYAQGKTFKHSIEGRAAFDAGGADGDLGTEGIFGAAIGMCGMCGIDGIVVAIGLSTAALRAS